MKLKKFEMGRLSILYAEMDGKFKEMLLEKERLAEKLDVSKLYTCAQYFDLH